MTDATDEGRTYTVRLELVDRPGELLRALEPISDNGGNLLSILHERGNRTPRGHVPVEVALSATPGQFETIVEALREGDINVIEAGQEQYGEEFVVVLVGDLLGADLSGTVEEIQRRSDVSVRDLSLSGPDGSNSSARLRLATDAERVSESLAGVREVAEAADLRLVEPLAPGGNA